jgi:hypothetical protein
MDELIDTLPEIADFDDVTKRPYAFISKKGDLLISGEHGDDLIDYYGDYRGGTPYIHSELVAWASKNGGYWEWVHPGAICFVS